LPGNKSVSSEHKKLPMTTKLSFHNLSPVYTWPKDVDWFPVSQVGGRIFLWTP
jgi:hypothetical protein